MPGMSAVHLQPAPLPTFLLTLIRDAAGMPVNVGLRWLTGTSHAGPRQGGPRGHRGSCGGCGSHSPPVPVTWGQAGPSIPSPGLMQSLPASSWLGAPGQAWVPGPGSKGF